MLWFNIHSVYKSYKWKLYNITMKGNNDVRKAEYYKHFESGYFKKKSLQESIHI